MKQAIIVSQDSSRRAMLHQLLEHGHRCDQDHKKNDFLETIRADRWFEKVQCVGTLEQALGAVAESRYALCVFVESNFSSKELAGFIEKARQWPQGSQGTYIILLKKHEFCPEVIARNMVVGFHGFLAEPFSTDTVHQIIELAEKVQNDGSAVRLRTATNLLLKDALATISKEAALDVQRQARGNFAKNVAETYRHLKQLSGASLCAPVVQELAPLAPSERDRQFVSVLDSLRKRLRRLVPQP